MFDLNFHHFITSKRSQTECCLAALGCIGRPAAVAEVVEVLKGTGLHHAASWNIGRALKAASPKTAQVNKLWSLTPSGKEWLAEVGLARPVGLTAKPKSTLRELLQKIDDKDAREFVAEAIFCLEYDLRRSAVVMSWLASVHLLKVHVFKHHRNQFDSAVAKIDSKWKPARSLDDYGRMKEIEFLNRLAALSVIGKNVKTELVECLNRRNACGHPNSYSLGDATVAHHIEILILNVFSKFT